MLNKVNSFTKAKYVILINSLLSTLKVILKKKQKNLSIFCLKRTFVYI